MAFDLNDDGIACIRCTALAVILGREDWQRGDRFVFDGFEYRVGRAYGDHVDVIPTEY